MQRMLLIAIPVALLIGASLGALGAGGSILTVPALVYLLGQNAHAATTGSLVIVGIIAVGTSLLVIAINSATALAARTGQHITLDWPLLGAFTAVALLGSLGGGQVSSRINPDRLTVGFVVLLYGVAAYTGVRSGAHLL